MSNSRAGLSRRGFLAGVLSLPLVALLPAAKMLGRPKSRRMGVDPVAAAQWELNERFHRGPNYGFVHFSEPAMVVDFDSTPGRESVTFDRPLDSTEWPWG